MIINWISFDNRKKRRAMAARARKRGLEMRIQRACSSAVAAHIVILTDYLSKAKEEEAAALAELEQAATYLPVYLGSKKTVDESEREATTVPAVNGERVLYLATRNLLCETLEDQQFELALIAGLAPGPEDPIEHIVISWEAGEHPTHEQVEETIDILLEISGMQRHQAYAALHGDTAHTHLHVAVNRVDPLSGKRKEFGNGAARPFDALHQAIAVIAHRQGRSTQANALYVADNSGCYDADTKMKVLDRHLKPCATPADWRKIREVRRERENEKKVGADARRFELRTGISSLQRRVIEEARPVFEKAKDWDQVHRELAPLGMRFVVLESGGAIIECGDRRISASTAWSGASAAKMIERLGAYREPPLDCIPAPFIDREFEHMAGAIEERRKRKMIKNAERLANASAATATHAAAVGYDEALEALVRDNNRADLNELRRHSAEQPQATKAAIDALRKREIQRRKAWRRLLNEEGLVDDFLDEHDEDSIGAILVGSRGQKGLVETPIATSLAARRDQNKTSYYRDDGRLAFVESSDRIDLYLVRDEEVLREAMLLAKAKWGSVVATGDQATLLRLARIAVDEKIELTNPELQPIMAEMRREDERLRQELELRPLPPAIEIADLTFTVLADYNAVFTDWHKLNQADAKGAEELAVQISYDKALAAELAELVSQKIPTAVDLMKMADRAARRPASLPAANDEAGDKPPLSTSAATAMADPRRSSGGWMPINRAFAANAAITKDRRSEDQRQFSKHLALSVHRMAMCGTGPSLVGGHFLVRVLRGEFAQPAGPNRPLGRDEETFRILLGDPDYNDLVRRARARKPLGSDIDRELARWRDPWTYYGQPDMRDSKRQAARFLDLHDIQGELDQLRVATEPETAALVADPPRLTMIDNLVVALPEHRKTSPITNPAGYFYQSVQNRLLPHYLLQQEERRDLLEKVATGRLAVTCSFHPHIRDYQFRIVPEPATPTELQASLRRHSGDPEFLVDVDRAQTGDAFIPSPEEHPDHRVRAFLRARHEQRDKSVLHFLADVIVGDEATMSANFEKLDKDARGDLIRYATIPWLPVPEASARSTRRRRNRRKMPLGQNRTSDIDRK